MSQGYLFVMSAASGAGKTTLKDIVLPEFDQLRYSISCTTRPPRSGEIDGIHYFFKTKAEFERMIAQNELVEWNQVHGNYYGTPKRFIESTLAQGASVFLDLDVFGKVNFDKIFPAAVGILVEPPSLAILEQRLRARGTESEDVIRLRLENSRKEREFAHSQGKYEHVIINDDLEKATRELRAVFHHYLNNPSA